MISAKYILSLSFLLIFYACSSTSIEQRYNKRVEKPDTLSKSSRFTSGNDEKTFQKEFDEEPIEENPVDVEKFVEKTSTAFNSTSVLTDREKVMIEIVKYLNTPYQYGGNNNFGIDCSAFTHNVFFNSLNFELPRTASQQYLNGESIISRNSLKFGDLVFFNTTKNSFPGHVGIYLGEDLFAHASVSNGVTISSIESNYYKVRFVGARRNLKIVD
ncbi:MAG: hypothetical protein COW71_04195 [Ignavibacteriales bacterium CG18_big_fil_WC_8_21_14_2_50_31_20]|nr:MAG: hypothetical protein COW71_04195 [Ignavibacteriales bacterium CG18_big_fil_WC_8_21_14_2_50_31_20]